MKSLLTLGEEEMLKPYFLANPWNIVPLEGQADDVYQQTVRALNAYFHVQENAANESYVLRQLRQEPGEDVDSFVVRLRKQARHLELRSSNLQ